VSQVGRVVQVSVSDGGVPKRAVQRALVGRLGLEGDAHHHDAVHGGPLRAVCLFAIEAIERVRADGHAGLGPGAIGENVTTEGIELARLAVGARLEIGDEVVLEITGPANPCDVIRGAFVAGKSGRVSILLHPDDFRMYARVLSKGEIRTGDAIRVLPPLSGSDAPIHHRLDLLDSVEREAWLTLWQAAAQAGFDVRILNVGDMAGAASPGLPGSVFNRAFGMRQVPGHRRRMENLFRDAGVTGWLVVGVDDAEFAGQPLDDPVGVHTGSMADVLRRVEAAGLSPAVRGVEIRRVAPDDAEDVDRWAELFIAGNDLDDRIAGAWRRLNPFLVRSRGQQQFIASVDGRDVAASATFTRRRVAWLGAATVLPNARGRGIQRALIADRVLRANQAGSLRVMATADVDSVSAANLESLGIERIWTRALARVDSKPA